jgi:hypothetical protein
MVEEVRDRAGRAGPRALVEKAPLPSPGNVKIGDGNSVVTITADQRSTNAPQLIGMRP